MTREQAREAAAVMLAWADGKEVEIRLQGIREWEPTDSPRWNWDNFDYRIKPTSTLRPWTADEVPLGAWLRSKRCGWKAVIIEITSDQNIGIFGSYFSHQFVLKNCEHSTDGGKTWLPCGVMEESK